MNLRQRCLKRFLEQLPPELAKSGRLFDNARWIAHQLVKCNLRERRHFDHQNRSIRRSQKLSSIYKFKLSRHPLRIGPGESFTVRISWPKDRLTDNGAFPYYGGESFRRFNRQVRQNVPPATGGVVIPALRT